MEAPIKFLFVSREFARRGKSSTIAPGTHRARRNEPGPERKDHYRAELHPRVPNLAVRMGRTAKKLDWIAEKIGERNGLATTAKAMLAPARFAIASMVARASHEDVVSARRIKRQKRIDATMAEARRRREVRERHHAPVAVAA